MNYDEIALARQYSEGNDELYNCLIKLWQKNFETIGCCSGHIDKLPHNAYIGFKFENNDNNIKLLSSLDKKNVAITFVSQDQKKAFSIRQLNDTIYDNIICSIDKNEYDRILKNIFDFMDGYKDTEHITIRIHYNNYKYKIFVNTCNKKIIDKLKINNNYKILNEKINLYHFELNM